MQIKHAHSLTEGRILTPLMLFALPMLVGNLLQQVYNVADMLIVGRFVGAEALAAVGSAYSLMTFLTSVVIGLCMGSSALFSIRIGAGEMAGIRQDIFLSALFIFPLALCLILGVSAGVEPVLSLLQVPIAIFPMLRGYVSILFPGIFFTALYNFYAYLLRSDGDSSAPMLFLVAASLVNILLDLWFVIGLKLGVNGAAAATVIAQALSGLGLAFYAWKTRPAFRLHKADCRWDGPRFRQIILNDIVTGLQQSVMNFGILMIQGLVNSFGVTVMAAFAAGVKIDTVAYMPAQEFANAYSIFISQNLGAGKHDRIRRGTRLSLITSVLFCAASSLCVFLAAPHLIALFLDAPSTEILAEGTRYLRLEGFLYLGLGILMLLYGYYRGIRRPEVSLLLTVVSLGTRVVLSYLLAPHTPLGVVAIWLSIPTGWILADLTGLGLMKRLRPEGQP